MDMGTAFGISWTHYSTHDFLANILAAGADFTAAFGTAACFATASCGDAAGAGGCDVCEEPSSPDVVGEWNMEQMTSTPILNPGILKRKDMYIIIIF